MSDDAPVTNALRLADHELLREIGRGGMGVVYLARQRMLDRLEVLKVMNESLVRDSEAAERFLREIRAAARLHHPNIVTAYSASMVDRTLTFAMEYVEGVDLAKLVAARGPLPIGEACHYAREAALGLAHAAEAGMAHRDIKPSNLLVTSRGGRVTLKILDFGLAKATQETAGASGLTLAGQFLGTPDYIAPEQARDAATADSRSDIYSLGCTLYFMLAGAPPFQGNVLAVLRSHESDAAKPLSNIRGELPAELDAILTRMLAKYPAERFSTCQDVAAALAPFAAAPDKQVLDVPDLASVVSRVFDTKSSKKENTATNPYRSPRADLIAPKANAAALMSIDAPWAVRWFPAYCLIAAFVSICLLILLPLELLAERNPEMFGMRPLSDQQFLEQMLGFAIIGIPTLIGAIAFVCGMFLRRRPSTWAIGLVLLIGGVCLVIPGVLGLPLAYYWLQEETRRYFEQQATSKMP